MVYINFFQENLVTKDAFNLRLEFVYHDYASHFRILARFDRGPEEKDHVCGEFHRAYLNLPQQAFTDVLDRSEFSVVDDISEAPETMQNDPSVGKSHARKFLCIIGFDFKYLDLINLHNPFTATTSGAEFAIQELRKIRDKSGKFKLYVHASDVAHDAFTRFQKHLLKEPLPLEKYYHKTGNYM